MTGGVHLPRPKQPIYNFRPDATRLLVFIVAVIVFSAVALLYVVHVTGN